MTTPTDARWIDRLIVELRLRDVPGPVIGDAVASARELIIDSGRPAEEVFGDAREYAAALDLPRATPRVQALLSALWAPVLGLVAFLAFVQASSAWFRGEPLLLSAGQVALLAVIVALVVALPAYLGALLRHRWLAVVVVLLGGAAGLASGFLAPTDPADAWLTLDPAPVLIVTASILVVLSVVSTVLAVRSRDRDTIIEPLDGEDAVRAARSWSTPLLVVHWMFPVLALLMFALTWLISR